jgi:hypothetical protein
LKFFGLDDITCDGICPKNFKHVISIELHD